MQGVTDIPIYGRIAAMDFLRLPVSSSQQCKCWRGEAAYHSSRKETCMEEGGGNVNQTEWKTTFGIEKINQTSCCEGK